MLIIALEILNIESAKIDTLQDTYKHKNILNFKILEFWKNRQSTKGCLLRVSLSILIISQKSQYHSLCRKDQGAGDKSNKSSGFKTCKLSPQKGYQLSAKLSAIYNTYYAYHSLYLSCIKSC